MKEIIFRDWKCKLEFKQYSNQRIAIELIEIGTNEPIAIATVNMPNVPLEDNQVCIKDYSENEGILQVLIDAGIVSHPVGRVASGFVSIPICELLISPYGT
jgi:hypothetical protein